MDFYSAAATDAGTRRKENQDNLYVEQFVTEQGKIAFAVLCDGMGGMEHGEIASEMLVSAFYRWAQDALRGEPRLPLEEYTIRRQWLEAVKVQNEAIRARSISLFGKIRDRSVVVFQKVQEPNSVPFLFGSLGGCRVLPFIFDD